MDRRLADRGVHRAARGGGRRLRRAARPWHIDGHVVLAARPDDDQPRGHHESPGQARSRRPGGYRAVVRGAINAHDYGKAWNLGGRNLGQSFTTFVQGYSGTAHDDLTILSVSGNVVTAQLTATQTDGTVKTFRGTYTVSNGIITHFDINQTG
jgi:hypothetical protein